MDLGATICLARIPRCGACPLARRCPARGTSDEPVRKQSRFEGSFRQRRAIALRLVASATRLLGELDVDAIESLARDGLVVVDDGLVQLPRRRSTERRLLPGSLPEARPRTKYGPETRSRPRVPPGPKELRVLAPSAESPSGSEATSVGRGERSRSAYDRIETGRTRCASPVESAPSHSLRSKGI